MTVLVAARPPTADELASCGPAAKRLKADVGWTATFACGLPMDGTKDTVDRRVCSIAIRQPGWAACWSRRHELAVDQAGPPNPKTPKWTLDGCWRKDGNRFWRRCPAADLP